MLQKYEAMGTAELEQILKQDAEGTHQYDENTIWAIMGILAERRRANPEKEFKPVEQAWKEFQPRIHLPVKRKFRRAAGIAAVIAAVIFSSTMTFQAAGFSVPFADVFKLPALSGKTVHQQDSPDSRSLNQYSGLQDALEKNGITDCIVPNWMPDGFSFALIDVQQSEKFIHFEAQYVDIENQKTLSIAVTHGADLQGSSFFPDNSPVLIYKTHGIEHYILSHQNYNMAAWLNGRNECIISGDVSQKNLIKMISSIY